MLFSERAGLIIWTHHLKSTKAFERYGNVHYMSRKMQYVVLYVDAAEADEISAQLRKMPNVRKVERSLRGEIPTEFSNTLSDKSQPFPV